LNTACDNVSSPSQAAAAVSMATVASPATAFDFRVSVQLSADALDLVASTAESAVVLDFTVFVVGSAMTSVASVVMLAEGLDLVT